MISKMAMRKHLLPNMKNHHVCEMLKSSLWGPDIFPEEAFEDLKTRNPGRKLESLLGIQGTVPKEYLNWTGPGTSANSNFRPSEPPHKKQKLNSKILVSNTPQVKQGWNKRGSRGGKKNKGNKNNGNDKRKAKSEPPEPKQKQHPRENLSKRQKGVKQMTTIAFLWGSD